MPRALHRRVRRTPQSGEAITLTRVSVARKLSICLFLVAALLLLITPLTAQKLEKGVLLVAARELPDPNFAETVVLLTHYDAKAAMGLILNRPARLPVTNLLKEWKSAETHAETVYAGGPVERGALLAILRSSTAPDQATTVLEHIHLLSKRDALDAALASGNGPNTLRIYLGYAGWGEGQLDREVRMGAWRIERATPELIFAKDVTSLWRRLIERSEAIIARRFSPVAADSRYNPY